MMSTSPSRAPEKQAVCLPLVEAFPYDSVVETAVRDSSLRTAEASEAADAASYEKQAHSRGLCEGKAEAQKKFEEQLARERSALAAALAQFTRDRAAYFQNVEREVVQLALSIARKILHREAQVDPLLLAGIARVALEKVEGATGVTLHVHPQNAADWRRFLSLELDPADLPQIVEDPAQNPDTCLLETAMGTAALGLDVQLKEIEQGLMDLLAARPGAGL
jgi:flagellar assembly protein FliH